ncbi:MAG: AsmA-like C-terminal region-containing protein [Bacteroidota bacterium]
MKKILKVLGIILLLILIALFAIPYFFQDKIVNFVKTELNKELNAHVDFADYGLSLFSNFPDFTFKLNDFKIDGQGTFEGTRLLGIEKAEITLDLASVLGGEEYKIKHLIVDELVLNALVNESGLANYDIMKEEFDTDTTVVQEDAYPYKILLEGYEITDSKIVYDNQSLGALVEVEGLNHSGSGQLSDQYYELITETNAQSANIIYEGTAYLSDALTEIDAKFNISDEFRQFDLLENDIRINDLHLTADGQIYMPEDGFDMDINYKTTESDLLTLLSLIPADYMPEMSGIETNGTVNLNGVVKGKYDDNNLPGFTLNGTVDNGFVKYPDLPSEIKDIQIEAHIDAPEGKDFSSMKVDIPQFHMELAENPIDANLLLRDALSEDPYMKSSINSQIDFSSVKDALPLEGTDELNGFLTADVDLEGNLSSIENEDYNQFKASGTASLVDFDYISDSIPYETHIKSAYLNFSPQLLDLSKFDAEVGSASISAKGKIDNYIAWFLNDETLRGRFTVNSNFIDLNQFMSESSSEMQTATEEEALPLSVIEVPKNVDIELNAQLEGLKYDNVDMRNVAGKIEVKEAKATLKDLRMEVLNGVVVVNGSYDTKDINRPQVDFNYKIEDIGIKESASTFNTVNTLAPIAKRCLGSFDSGMSFSTALNENMEPIYESMKGDGNAFTSSVVIKNFEPLAKIANILKLDQFAEQAIKNVKVNFAFDDGRVTVKPFDVRIDDMDAEVAGSTGFEGDMDYTMKLKVPTAKLGGNANQWMSSVLGKANDLGLNASLGEFVNVNLGITGTVDEPKIKPVFQGMEGQSVQEVIQDKVEEVITQEVIDPAKENAKAEAEKIMADAQAQSDKIMEEARKSADLVRKEADKQAKKLVDEANNPLAKIAAETAAKKVKKEADKNANKIIETAQKKSDDLLKKAQAQADAKLQ